MFSCLKNWLRKRRIVVIVYNLTTRLFFGHRKTRAQLEIEVADLQERLDWFIKHSEITALKPATGYLRKKQLDLLEFTDVFFSAIASLDLHPFLIGGNLIGAYRHKGFVPWDDDLDFGLIRKEYEKLIDYCRKNFHVTTYNGKWSKYNTDKHLDRMNDLVRQYPNEYILDIWVDQIQIMRGTSAIDRLAIDFWSFDYYAEDYDIKEHVRYLNELSEKKKAIDYVDKIVRFLKEERASNHNISLSPTKYVFPGIDNVEGYLRTYRSTAWLKTEQLFPLKYEKYESKQYYVPNDIEGWMAYEYPDYKNFPSDVGKTPHEWYKENYIMKYMPTVEFYLIDAFEIYHFIPLYNFFEKNGIFARFVAEKPKKKDAWFDYEEAVQILEKNGIRYKTIPDYNVDYVFTTQDEIFVDKYKNKKIHMCYGVGLTSYSFCETQRSVQGFDLKLVHGTISYNAIKKRYPSLSLIKVGYLKYSSWSRSEYLYNQAERELLISKNNLDKKPILLYFPTWDSASSITKYEEGFKKLKEQFFIVTKAHHCTFRLASEKKHRQILNLISDIVLEGNYSFEMAVKLSDLAVCDAISGAATEVPFINHNVRLVLLKSPDEEKNKFKEFFDKYAVTVDSSDALVNAVKSVSICDPFSTTRNMLMKKLYSEETDLALQQLKDYIINNCSKRR